MILCDGIGGGGGPGSRLGLHDWPHEGQTCGALTTEEGLGFSDHPPRCFFDSKEEALNLSINGMAQITDLPAACWIAILQRVAARDVLALACTCKELAAAANDELLWRELAKSKARSEEGSLLPEVVCCCGAPHAMLFKWSMPAQNSSCALPPCLCN